MAMRITNEQLKSLDNVTVNLNQDDKLASETEGTFNVVLKPLTRTESTKLQLKYANEDNTLNVADLQKALFIEQVVSWNGLFEDEHGQNIEANDDFKEKVYEYPMFRKYSSMIENKLAEINGLKVKEEEDIKKNVENQLAEG